MSSTTQGRLSSKVLFGFLIGFVLGALTIQLMLRTSAPGLVSQPMPSYTEMYSEQVLQKTLSPGKLDTSSHQAVNQSAKVNTIQQRFQARHRILQTGCQHYRQERNMSEESYDGDYMIVPHQAFYCGIEKTGSSEWKSVFKNFSSHNVKVRRYLSWSGPLAAGPNSYKSLTTRFFFVREPYGRLLSAYVDKLLSPNVMFWRGIGRYIVKRFRPNPSELSLKCGHDVTFSEFIDYVIDVEETGHMANGHFTPQFKHCYMCEFPYNYIGHLETVTEDRQFLLDAMHSPVEYSKDYLMSSLEHQVSWYISDQHNYKQCITVDEALRRLWQKSKIRGSLHPGIKYPLTASQSAHINVSNFLQVAKFAVEQSAQYTALLKDSKRLALIEAFSSVASTKKERIRELFRWDFELFGYDPNPEEVFGQEANAQDQKKSWKYFDLWG